MYKVAAALAALAALVRCGPPMPSVVSPVELESRLSTLDRPTVVLLWADWSRASVELLPAAGELAREYEGAPLSVLTVCLGESPSEDLRRELGRFPSPSPHFALEGDPTVLLARYGVADIPAALVFSADGRLQNALGSTDAAPLSPADLADAMAAALDTD